jgi:hypothetical protein
MERHDNSHYAHSENLPAAEACGEAVARRVRPGDVFEFDLGGSFASLQYVERHQPLGPLVRVLELRTEVRPTPEVVAAAVGALPLLRRALVTAWTPETTPAARSTVHGDRQFPQKEAVVP